MEAQEAVGLIDRSYPEPETKCSTARGLITKTFRNNSGFARFPPAAMKDASVDNGHQRDGHATYADGAASFASSPSLSLEEDIGFAVPDSPQMGSTSTQPTKMMLDRPCHNLELAIRGRSRTHETQNVTSSDSEEDDISVHDSMQTEETSFDIPSASDRNGAIDADGLERGGRKNQPSQNLSPEMQRLFQSAPMQKRGENDSNSSSPAPISSSSFDPAVRDPVPQRRPPSFVAASNPGAPDPPVSPSSQSPSLEGNRERVGSVGGAFSRYSPKVEGCGRKVVAVNSASLSITWGEMALLADNDDDIKVDENYSFENDELQVYEDEKFHGAFVSGNADDVSSVDTASLIQSQPQMSAIAKASTTWQQMMGRNILGAKSGSTRTFEDDDISSTPSSITDLNTYAYTKQPESRRRCSWFLPSCYKRSPPHIKLIIVASVSMVFMLLMVVFVACLYSYINAGKADNSNNSPHGHLTISDEPSYPQMTWEEWNNQKSKRGDNRRGIRSLRSLIHT